MLEQMYNVLGGLKSLMGAHAHLSYAIPFAAVAIGMVGVSVVKKFKSILKWTSVAAVASVSMFGVNQYKQYTAHSLSTKVQAEQEESQRWDAYRKQILPGKWKNLFDEMLRCENVTARIAGISHFVQLNASQQPKISIVGLDEFLKLFNTGDALATQSYKQKVYELLSQHMVAISS